MFQAGLGYMGILSTIADEVKALGQKPPTPEPPDAAMEFINGRTLEPGSGHYLRAEARFGTPTLMLQAIAKRVKVSREDITALKRLQASWASAYAEMNRFALRQPRDLYFEQQTRLGEAIAAGTELSDPLLDMDGWTSRRNAMIDAYKSRMRAVAGEAFAIVKPLYLLAADEAMAVLKERLEHERAECRQWGIPHEVSQMLLSLRESRKAFLNLAESQGLGSPAAMTEKLGINL